MYACAVCLDVFDAIEEFDAHRERAQHGYMRRASVEPEPNAGEAIPVTQEPLGAAAPSKPSSSPSPETP